MATDPFLVRTTLWHDDQGNLRQISACVLDADWDPQAEITAGVGPFDDPIEVVRSTTGRALAAAWWITGQQRLIS